MQEQHRQKHFEKRRMPAANLIQVQDAQEAPEMNWCVSFSVLTQVSQFHNCDSTLKLREQM